MMQFSTVNAVVPQIEVFSILCAVFYMLQTIKKRKKKKLLKEDRRKLADKLGNIVFRNSGLSGVSMIIVKRTM